MYQPSPLHYPLAARQERLLYLDAGAELRCRSGHLLVRFGGDAAGTAPSGRVSALGRGQALRMAAPQWATVEATEASQVELWPAPEAAAAPEAPHCAAAQAQKNRQGLGGLWRWCAQRLTIRRGTRAA
ncbi:MAG: hypothetical protein V4505_02980 [Pseudomonadota bacterium]